jgi:hypothetical protein
MSSTSLSLSSTITSEDGVESANATLSDSQSSLQRALSILYRFSRQARHLISTSQNEVRPHTIKGTALASFMGVARAVLERRGAVTWALLPRAALGLIALLAGNAYIVGLNQIYDVQIDEVAND